MSKKCTICGGEAVYLIKDSSDYYCDECAQENFDDVNYLVKVEEQAQQLKKLISEASQEDSEQ